MSKEERLPKKENFSEWYHALVRRILIDQRYPLQGFLVYRPYGYFIIDRYLKMLEEMLAETGHCKCYFPALIPERLIARESEHLRGYENQIFWVTHFGLEEAEEKAALRPTSETAMYEMLRYWIRSWRDLPLKIHQSCTVFRYETGHTRPLIREREILWNEAHTSHETLKDAKKQIKVGMKIYSKLFDRLCIPYIWIDVIEGLFPGAVSAYEIYTVFPSGRALEMGSVNNLGQAFSKAFDVKFKTRDGKEDYVWQTSYGVSERLLSAIVAIHGDDKGLVLPPEIAPIQIVIVPIVYGENKEKILDEAKKIKKTLKKYRIHLDDRDWITPGEKFYIWEMHGVPLRIEIGPKDVEKRGVTLVRRDTGDKIFVEITNLNGKIKTLFKEIYENMKTKAWEYHSQRIKNASSIEEIIENIEEKRLSKVNWCGNMDCASNIERSVNAVFIGKDLKERPKGKCICGEPAKYIGYVGKMY